MPLTFIDIERQKNWRIALFFAVLLLVYLAVLALIGAAFLGIPLGMAPWFWVFAGLASLFAAGMHFWFAAHDTVNSVLRSLDARPPDPQGRGRRDEAGVTAHQLHEAESVLDAERLGVRAVQDACRLLDRRQEPERSTHERDVVVDRFRHTDNRERVTASSRSLVERLPAALRAIPADGEEDPHVAGDQALHSGLDVHGSARGPENGPAPPVDAVHDLRRENEGFVASRRVQALVAIAEAKDARHAVPLVQLHEDGADDVVEARAQATSGHDGGGRHGRVEDAADAVISGIPFSTMPRDVADRIAAAIARVLAPGGRFVAYQVRPHVADYTTPYLGQPRKEWELINVPPVRVFTWTRAG